MLSTTPVCFSGTKDYTIRMNVLVIYAHHEPTSLTGSLKNTAVSLLVSQGHEVVESDLYAMGFQPSANKYDFQTMSGNHYNYMLEQKNASARNLAFSPDIVSEVQKLKNADVLLVYAPIWWFSVPAILKGWFDRVLAMGVAWDGGKIYEEGLLRGKRVMLTVTAGGPEEYYQPLGRHKATLRQILHPIHHGTFAFCGMDVLEPFIVYSAMSKSPMEYAKHIEYHRNVIATVCTEPYYLTRYS